ncbi:hypothetical protein Q7A53_05305 [Halobacillus rhizosphaerae]|uniref:hypothetical protein n=1 Tax=Halobacillus rhizosphaerae TaxID=3064889 RepID=UPI00398A6263
MSKMKLTAEQEKLFANCKWCNGSGTERAHINDTGYPCPDCEGTGMQGGKFAEEMFDQMIEELYEKSKKENNKE